MTLPNKGWKNKSGTANRSCSCGSWKNHWINNSEKAWPSECSVWGCTNKATLGAHVINSEVSGERIVPVCDSCNKLSGEFTLGKATLVPAKKQTTCQ